MTDMPEWIRNAVPFMLTAGTGKAHFNIARVIEGLVIAALASYLTVSQLEYRIHEVEKKVDKIVSDIYVPSIPK